ncbi:TonB-dependent receptor [Adhaeribacter radiodurans]|uniref:TonB-dependent receptor n=1 Tax=Adhaeribacter radiodurans TaxID=2745197 RepID=A0A7L7LC69_9BACT|nr:TonB-dependent receptor [Adhaeribacter radiodurans]QMU30436.1 TonB-dependent receptor [Adhaeribacter radiodurans]
MNYKILRLSDMGSKVTKLILALFLGLGQLGWAQETPWRLELRGQVMGLQNKPVSGANIQVTKEPAGTLVKVEVSDFEGRFVVQNLAVGTYKVVITHFDFAVYQSAVIPLEKNVDLGVINLSERATTLKEVDVVGKKPFIEQQFDKTVLNVENSITAAGNTVLEVLEKAPGVNVDQNDNISMRGRPGVIVMIDGKRVPMSGTELANMLRGLSANSVEKIDLITNPSAKYEAAGNAGIIDIRLKKDKRMGTNGTLTSSFGHGKYEKSNQGVQVNHRGKKINLFASYNYVHRSELSKLDIYREFFEGLTYIGAYDQKNNFGFILNNHSARVGMDYYVSPKTIVGVVVNGFANDINRTTDNKAGVLDEQHQPASSFLTKAITGTNRYNGSANLNLKHTLDSLGREISADFDYISYKTTDIQDYTTNYFNLQNEPTRSPYLLYGDLDGDLIIQSAKVDYTQPLKGIKGKLEAGLKSSSVKADNNLQFLDRSNNGNVLDPSKSNHFIYKENINAAYLNASKKWSKASLQLGLRVENTIADGKQLSDGQEFNRNYTQLFPSAFVGYTVNKMHDLGLSLSRRIDRPTYNQLNPFKYFLDPSTYSTGNPFLKPQLTYSVEFTHTIKQKITTKYSYSRTTDNIISVLSPDPELDKVVIQTDRNLAKYNYYGINLSVPASIGNWFNSVTNASFYYGLYQGNLANTNLRNGRPTFNINSNNTFVLNKDWTAEVTGEYQAREIYGFLDIKPIWFVTGGIQKQLWQKKANVKLNVTDAFYTNKVRAITALTGYTERFFQRRDSRVATISFTYQFGQSQAAPARRRSGGAEDEKRRAG